MVRSRRPEAANVPDDPSAAPGAEGHVGGRVGTTAAGRRLSVKRSEAIQNGGTAEKR